jgi:hypothetical protein
MKTQKRKGQAAVTRLRIFLACGDLAEQFCFSKASVLQKRRRVANQNAAAYP